MAVNGEYVAEIQAENATLRAQLEQERARVAELEAGIGDIESKAKLAASMMGGDKRGQLVADAFSVIGQYAKRLRNQADEAEKGGSDER